LFISFIKRLKNAVFLFPKITCGLLQDTALVCYSALMMNNEKNQIGISDIGLASLLVTLNFEIIELEQGVNTKRINFVFRNQAGMEEVIAKFWADKTFSIPIHSLFNNQKILKNRIWAK
jgi:hypothetical protein